MKLKENLDSKDKLLTKIASRDKKILELVKGVTRGELLQKKELLLKQILVEKQKSLIELVKQYLDSEEKDMFNLKPGERYSYGVYGYLSRISAETNIPVHILRTCISAIDSQYCADKYIASRYVDKFSRDCFASWFNDLPERDNQRDVLDLIVMAIMRYRGRKLKGKIRRFIGTVILKIMGEYNK